MINLIQLATANESNDSRQNAEKTIIEMREQNPDQFFQEIIEIFSNKETPVNIRLASGTIIAVSIITKGKTGDYIWDQAAGNTKNKVKNVSLEVLIDNDRSIRRSSANIVSAICYLELPRNEWEGIVEKICVNVSHDNEIVKEASILTLGFICSRMRERSDYSFPQNVSDNILSGIILGIQQNQALIVETALKALRDSLGSLGKTLVNEQYRTFIISQLVNVIGSDQYSLDGLQILGEFVKTCYEFLGPYIEGINTLLEPLISRQSNEETCIAAMEVWENMAAEFKDQSDSKKVQNYITGQIGQSIVTSLLKNLAVMEDGEDSDENPISDSASKSLETIFENGSIEYKDLVLNFVKIAISQNDWKHRQASIKAFSLLLYGLPDDYCETLISSSINELINLLGDNSVQVQFAALDSLTIITEVCGKFILKSDNFLNYLKLILSKLTVSEKFLRTGCRIIDNLCESEKEEKFNKFSELSNDLIEFFLKFSLANDSSLAVISWSTTTIMNIIEVTNNENVIRKYINFILENFDNIKNVGEREKKETLVSAFFTILQFCLHGLKGSPLDPQIVESVYTKVINSFKGSNDVNADGFYAIEALIIFFNRNMAIVNDFWVYIAHALTKWQDPTLFRATISCIASFINNYGEDIGDRLDSFVPPMIELLENPNFSKELKLDLLVLLGEVFLVCRIPARKYLKKFLDMIIVCCTAAVQITEIDFNYSEQLKDSIIEALMCVVHGLNEENVKTDEELAPYIPNVFHFVMLSCNKASRPTLSYLKKCVLLMADFAKFYPNAVNPLKKEPFIAECLTNLRNHNKNNEMSSTIKYAEPLLK